MNCRGCLISGIALLLAGLLALGVFTITVGHFLATEDAFSQADAIVVLGGEDGSFFRVRHAMELFNAGHAPVVVFSGGTLKDAGIACSSAQLSLEAAQQLGLPAEATVIADGAQSTYDEAVNIRRLARQRRWRSLIIVTDLFHTRRAARTFRTLLPAITIYVSAAPDPRYDASRWWQNEHSLVAVFNEMIKLGFYWLKYGITPVDI
nr:YdcF family protein [Anaerolineae bacterium]